MNYAYFSGLLILCALGVHETFVLGRKLASGRRGVGHVANIVALTLAVVLVDIPAVLAHTPSWTVIVSIAILLCLVGWHLYFGPILRAYRQRNES